MRKPKCRELKEAFKALFMGLIGRRYTSEYPFKPHTPPKKFRGKPVPDDDYCIGCMACSEVCPSDAIEVIDDPEKGIRTINRCYDRCIFCGQCEALCTTEKGVHLTAEFDLAAFDRKDLVLTQEFELVQCENCNTILGTKKHILWLAQKLGPLAYSNFPLILTAQKQLKIAEDKAAPPPPETKEFAEKSRSDMFRILCPKCRHQVLIFDQYGK